MRTLHAILMLLGALSVLLLGATATPAGADAVPPPCHEQAAEHGTQAPQHAPGDAMTAMSCCVACVSAPDIQPPVRGRIVAPSPPPAARQSTLPTGLSPAPEPGPPR